MNLHLDKDLFNQVVIMASEALKVNPAIIEKDYYVTFLLNELVKNEPNIIFKGGTSLSKCYKLINRFSEDIDLAYDSKKQKISEGKRRDLSHYIINTIARCGFELLNSEEIKSRRNYNQYRIGFDSEHSIISLKPHLIIETKVSIYSFPTVTMEADCLLYQYLMNQQLNDLIAEYGLEPFPIRTQSLERTYIDKIFAICDYYLTSNFQSHSRHLYDLYKIRPFINFDNDFISLVNEVRTIRSQNKMCPSSKQDVNVSEVLRLIIMNNIYMRDYIEITQDLLFEDVSYQDVLEALNVVAELGIF